MKKGIYIHYDTKESFLGVNKKIAHQTDFFSRYYMMKNLPIEKKQSSLIKSILWRLPGGSWGLSYNKALADIRDFSGSEHIIDFFYIRLRPLDRRYVLFLKSLRDEYPDSKILMEIATYPYDKELLQSRTMWPWYFKDHIQRKRLRGIIDSIVTVNDHGDHIWNIPTIVITNGINVDEIPMISKEKTDDVIRLLAVAKFQPSHGYERIIEGISAYYSNGGNRKIELHMIGNGDECEKYKKLAEQSGISNRVYFYGMLTGQELDEVYENKDIGLGAFGFYKRGIKKGSDLKVREYMAKGLPVATGAPNSAFDSGNGDEYHIEYSNEPGMVDIGKMIKWYDGLMEKYDSRINLAKNIRIFAKSYLDISITQLPVLNYLNKGIRRNE